MNTAREILHERYGFDRRSGGNRTLDDWCMTWLWPALLVALLLYAWSATAEPARPRPFNACQCHITQSCDRPNWGNSGEIK